MSDSVTQVEIEDVLSSIRRLVSEDARPRPVASQDAARSKLVLSPSQRVETRDGSEEDTPKTLVLEPSESALKTAEPAGLASLDDVGRLVEKAVEEQVAAAMPALEIVDFVPQQAAEPVDEAPVEPVQAPVSEGSEFERKLAELEALVARQNPDWEPEATETGGNAPDAEDEVSLQPWDEDIREESTESLSDILSRTLDEVQDEAIDEDPLVTLAEVEVDEVVFEATVVTLTAGESTADETEAETLSVEADPMGLAEPEVPVDQPEPALMEPAEADTLEEPARFMRSPHLSVVPDAAEAIDPEMLRALVADIVRQELQGALGERITRNVRKLVRREIQRALMAHSFD